MHYFSIFINKVNKPCVNFSAFGRKTQFFGNFEKNLKIFDKNSIEKFHFSDFWKGCLLKITKVCSNIFFQFRRGTFPVFPHLSAPM